MSETKTLREIIRERLDNIWHRIKSMGPDEVSKELVELSALIGTLGEKIVDFDQALANKQLEIWQEKEEISAKEVEIRSKITQEYQDLQKAKVLLTAIIETIRSLKYRLRVLKGEREGTINL